MPLSPMEILALNALDRPARVRAVAKIALQYTCGRLYQSDHDIPSVLAKEAGISVEELVEEINTVYLAAWTAMIANVLAKE